MGLRRGHALGLVGFGARGLGGLFAFDACGFRFLLHALGFLGADLRLQALALQFRTRHFGLAAGERKLQAVVVALQVVALPLEDFGFGAGARHLDTSLGHVDPVLALAAPRFLQLRQRRARKIHLRRRMRAEHGSAASRSRRSLRRW